jgi:hypothetical protein
VACSVPYRNARLRRVLEFFGAKGGLSRHGPR